jgi:Ca2+/H+ antiporter
VVVASGAVLAALAFVVLPYYSIYSGYFLAAQTLDEKWWLELILAVLPLDLNFSLLEVAMFGLVTGLYALISLDGESTWLEGLQLCAF